MVDFRDNKFIKRLRKSYAYRNGLIDKDGNGYAFSFTPDFTGEDANHQIYSLLDSDQPCMIARFGGTELAMLSNYLDYKTPYFFKPIKFILNQLDDIRIDKNKVHNMSELSGFFSNDIENIEKFCELLISDIPKVDILGSWLEKERTVKKFYSKEIKTVGLVDLEPYYHKNPWSRVLENKKVLVVHPFSESIEKQYEKREFLFQDKRVLPTFELKIIKAVQTIAGNNDTEFEDWFQALESMKNKMNETDFDIAIIGCGAYGFHLAAHAKRLKKKAVHMGGGDTAFVWHHRETMGRGTCV